MKIRTVVISVVVSASLVCGAGYGAYYTMKGKEQPVEVAPVMNLNNTYWDESSVYGSVTSQVSQIVNLKEEYQIEDIFVKAGDEVKKGDPLFSYDMTLQELELEMEKLTLQTSELEKVRLEKELERLKNTRATASLEANDVVRTAAAEDSEILDEGEPPKDGSEDTPAEGEGTDGSPATENAGGSDGDSSQGEGAGDGEDKKETGDGEEGLINAIEVQKGEIPAAAAASTEEERQEQERLALISGVGNYETLLAGVDGLYQVYGDSLNAKDIGPAVKEAVSYYRKNLAEERNTEETDEKGGTVQVRKYVLKDNVKAALGEQGTEELEKYGKLMEKYHGVYVSLLIGELDLENPGNISELLAQARAEYDSLTTEAQKEVTNLVRLEELEAAVKNEAAVNEAGGEDAGPGSGTTPEGTEGSTETPGSAEPDTSSETPGPEGSETPGETGVPAEETTPTEPESGAEPQSETQAEPGTESQSETGTQSETQTETAAQSGTESETESEAEPETRYTVKVSGGYIEVADQNLESESFPAGALVTVAAEQSDLQSFQEWSWITASDVKLEIEDPTESRITFLMPESDVELTALFLSNEEKIQNTIDAFYALAEEALGVIGTQKEEYDATALETALRFYQANLAEQAANIADGTSAAMEDYELRQAVADYLTAQEKGHEAENLAVRYKELCFTFVKTLVNNLEPQKLTREEYERAKAAYDELGLGWQEELDNSVYEGAGGNETEAVPDGMMSANGQTAGIPTGTGQEEQESQTGNGEETDTAAAPAENYGTAILTYGEKLGACEVILLIQEIDLNQPEELLIPALEQVRDAYLALNEAQRSIVWNADYLIELLKKYNLWQEETEGPGMDFPGDGGFDDFGGDPGYTAEELKEMIEDTERALKECALDIRENELSVKQKQRIVDEKVVKSTLDGTVITIGTKDGNSDNTEYFLKVSNETGLYAKGVMNELAFNTLRIGDTISGTSMNTGTQFTAVITEISEYPDPNGASMSWGWGTENTNASYYPFYALIDDAEGLEEGEAELKLEAPTDNGDAIYLAKFMVRTGNDGKSYVYKRGEDGKLMKQYVTLGKTIYSYAIQILDGLAMSDEIAFPYGKNVHEGAATKQVDMLEDAYM